jgi:peroxiredoxin
LYRFLRWSTVASMGNPSATLAVGQRVPEFTLTPANGPEPVSLSALRQCGPVIIEFLRGTW